MTWAEEESVAPPGKGEGVGVPEAKGGVGVAVAVNQGQGVGVPDHVAIPDALPLGLMMVRVTVALPLPRSDALKGGVVEGVWELVVVCEEHTDREGEDVTLPVLEATPVPDLCIEMVGVGENPGVGDFMGVDE